MLLFTQFSFNFASDIFHGTYMANFVKKREWHIILNVNDKDYFMYLVKVILGSQGYKLIIIYRSFINIW